MSGTHGVGNGMAEDFDVRGNTEVAHKKRLLLLSQAKCRAHCARLPTKEETRKKRNGSLTLTAGVNEASNEGGGQNSAVQ